MFQSPHTGRSTRTRSIWPAALAALALTASACQDASSPPESISAPASVRSFSQSASSRLNDEYIVVFNSSVSDVKGRANALVNAHGGNLHATYQSALRGFSAHMSAQAAQALAKEPGVAYVEADQEVSVATAQAGAPWGLDRIDQANMPLDGYYNYTETGAGVNVYIIDTGIRRTHTQFGGRVVAAFDGVGDGYGADGCHWHGTHIAGIVGGSTVGVAKSATLYSVRVFDCNAAASVSAIIAGVDWVTANKVRPAVATLALTSGLSSALNTAVANSINSGITYAVAAGNNTGDACGISPASVPAAITVGASASTDGMSSYSGYGTCVDLIAPGSQIYSAVNTDDTSLGLATGTSMSSAHVAGAAALYLQSHTSASPAEVAQAIVSSATAGVLSNVVNGTPNLMLRVNVSGGTAPPPPPPGNVAPTASFSASCSRNTCNFDGSASRDDSGIVSYRWDFGDGTSATTTGPTTKKVYSSKGNFSVTVKLTVSDAQGLTGTASQSVTIKNRGK